jgi:hypothetical protein
MHGSCSADNPIGAVFTPLRWARWLTREFGLAQKWIDGATICDPTAGEGVFVYALIDEAQTLGKTPDSEMLSRLYLIERSSAFLLKFQQHFRVRQGVEFPHANIFNTDVIVSTPSVGADILVGNPPWVNFTDLDSGYKETLKPYFIEYGLVHDTQRLLLGSSRIDLAALVIAKSIESILVKNGEATFFLPLSLFLNDGAHTGFRQMTVKKTSFAVSSIYDFGAEAIFDSVSTRFGVAKFVRDAISQYPVPYKTREHEEWHEQYAAPLHGDTSPLSILESKELWLKLKQLDPIVIQKDQLPRQGVNTCGANDIFIFDRYPSFAPDEYVYPLITRELFKNQITDPEKYILLPYDQTSGKPLDEAALKMHPSLWQYLNTHKSALLGRKGTMINAWTKRSIWWACLGVGPYCFTQYKLVWEAMGKKTFHPILLESHAGKQWQANQALHCFIPLNSRSEADALLDKFQNPLIERYLLSLNMAGTCNWAQPGRIKKLLHISSDEPNLNIDW